MRGGRVYARKKLVTSLASVGATGAVVVVGYAVVFAFWPFDRIPFFFFRCPGFRRFRSASSFARSSGRAAARRVTYRDAGRPLCAACGAALDRAHTYFDANGRVVCRACRSRGDLAEAHARILNARREPPRISRAYAIGRIATTPSPAGPLSFASLALLALARIGSLTRPR
ncbi:MAG TPA: hypothetical protein VK841_17720, partial [Polyangiaceae bacterium]|nr:hypothetical protein [Polyangiaceae bacterium]